MSDQEPESTLLDLHTFIRASDSLFSIEELCSTPGLTISVITEMVAFGIVEPSSGDAPAHWRFTPLAAQRSQRALRLAHDLELNLAGAALVLELMDELHDARARLRFLERQLDTLLD